MFGSWCCATLKMIGINMNVNTLHATAPITPITKNNDDDDDEDDDEYDYDFSHMISSLEEENFE